MDPPRLDAQACRDCLHVCANGVLADAANATPEGIVDLPKVFQLTIDLVGLCEGQLGPGVVMPFVNAGCEMHPAAVRAHVENVVSQCVEYMRHQPANSANEAVLEFILQECHAHLFQQARAEEERLRQQHQQHLQQQQLQQQQLQQQQQQEDEDDEDEYARKHGQDFRFGTFKRTWREAELRHLAGLFADDPDLDWAAATRMLNAHYAGRTVDGVPFTERTADAVRYQVAKRNIMDMAREIRNGRQADRAGEGSAAGPA